MPRKTQGVYDLVAAVLRDLPQPYGEDVIDDVCRAIESNPQYLQRYRELSNELRDWVVNNWIGQYTKDILGKQRVRTVSAKRATIITTYSQLSD